MILWMLLLPILMALIIWPLNKWRIVAAPLTSATLLVMALMCVTMTADQSILVLGRAVDLPLWAGMPLASYLVLIAILALATLRLDQELSYPLLLVAVSPLFSGFLVRDAALSAIMLQAGAILGVMLLHPKRQNASASGLNALVILSLALPLRLLSARSLQIPLLGQIAPGDLFIGTIALGLACGIVVAAFPFHVWLPSLFRHGSPSAISILGGVLGSIVLLRMTGMLGAGTFDGDPTLLLNMALYAGMTTMLAAGIGAWAQRTLRGALAYAALADIGFGLVALGLGLSQLDLLKAHLVIRTVAITIIAVAVSALRQCSSGDAVEDLFGAAHRAPLAVTAILVGGLSLAGWPPAATILSRLSIYQALSGKSPATTIVVMLSSLGPAWAFLRFGLACFRPADTPTTRREPLSTGLLLLPFVAFLLIPDGYALLSHYLPLAWPSFIPFP